MRRGAIVIDGDRVARDLQTPGSDSIRRIAERFPGTVDDTGVLDRGALAAVVFSDPDELAALNAIMLPAIRAEIRRRVEEMRESDAVVVLDLPLLAEGRTDGLSGILVVDVPPEVAIARLVQFRGMKRDDAVARMASQVSREARLAIADRVVDNSGDEAALEEQLDAVWRWMGELPPAVGDLHVLS